MENLTEEEILEVAKYWSNSEFVRGAERFLLDFAQGIVEAYNEKNGEIVLTSTEDGELVAVTRQDEEGRILKLIWSKK